MTVAALSVSACAPPSPAKPPRPSPSSTALFATDEEALAAAEEAYREYLSVTDAILSDGGSDPERLLVVASQSVYEKQLPGYRHVAENGWRGTGTTLVDSISIQDFQPMSKTSQIVIHACVDVSNVDVVDSSGRSVVSPSRPERTPFEVAFTAATSDRSLVLSGETPWSGNDFCV
ncbi:hypothetical protein ABIE21_000128 [Conyzicola nivalis]|uniref:Lipoprotein n=1 Tax=Conyzicola nivalis TaxID=1477021 RepID=A0ABV2QIE4_9MICO